MKIQDRVKTKGNKGITLIALVITIIVLLILAGVTIAALSGDNGILTRAKEAKEKTKQAQEDEKQKLSNMENLLGSYNLKNVNKADTNPAETIPENSIVLEDDANKGIVIKDKNNNEWVWVEVPKATVFSGLTIDTTQELTEQNYNDIKDKLITYVGVYRNGSATQTRNDWKDEWYAKDGELLVTASTQNLTEEQKTLNNGCGLTYEEYKSAYQKMLKSVYTYGGFWIGRYEAGIEGTTTETTNARKSHTTVTIGSSPKAISQKDAIPYNYVYCSEAQALAKEMTPNSNYTSSLMFGIQWDLVCKYLEVKGRLSVADIKEDSSSWGNYRNVKIENITSGKYKENVDRYNWGVWTKITNVFTKSDSGYGILLSTGISEYTKKMNIYNFASNEGEWTLEKSSNSLYPCAYRGGSCTNYGYDGPASYRNNNVTTSAFLGIGFRPALYAN